VASPFGGAKHSGFGLAGGADPLADYLQTRSLTVDATGASREPHVRPPAAMLGWSS